MVLNFCKLACQQVGDCECQEGGEAVNWTERLGFEFQVPIP